MKRTLIVMRHAKTEEQKKDQTDFERNLMKIGEADALKMAEIMIHKGFSPDLIMASSANRTRQTANIIAQQLNYDKGKIQFSDDLYLCDSRTIANSIENLNKDIRCCIIIGHNPGISEFAFHVNRFAINASLPTSGLVIFSLVSDSWQDLFMVENKIELFEYPKKNYE